MILLNDIAEAVSMLGYRPEVKYFLIPSILLWPVAVYGAFALQSYREGVPRNWGAIARHAANMIAMLALLMGSALFLLQVPLSTKAAARATSLGLTTAKLSFAQSFICGPDTATTDITNAAEVTLRSDNVLWPVSPGQQMQPLPPTASIPCDRLPMYKVVPELREIGRLQASSFRLMTAGGIGAIVALFALQLSVYLQMRRRGAPPARAAHDGSDAVASQEQSSFKAKW